MRADVHSYQVFDYERYDVVLCVLIKFFLHRHWARAGVILPGHTKKNSQTKTLKHNMLSQQVCRGPWAVGCGLWAVGLGPWAVSRGLWAVGRGLWVVGRVGQILRIAIITW